jgi:predicted N-formylglutamate amidohydrolase
MIKLIVTCEHGGNYLPKGFRNYLTDTKGNNTHRAFDAGALDLYKEISSAYSDFCAYSDLSRLLIDFNRSLSNRKIFSKYSSYFPNEKKTLLIEHYNNYRNRVIDFIEHNITDTTTIIHISTHTFVPVLFGIERNNDIGILYDPRIKSERNLAIKWKQILSELSTELKIRCNYPYLGKSDGFTTYLRKLFKINYLGIELEVNQKHVKHNKVIINVKDIILKSIGKLLSQYQK